MASTKYDLILVSLSEEQIEKAKEANGRRRRITHALLCGPYGQMFGTEKQCLKYYAAWSQIFPELFERAYDVETYAEIEDFESTSDLVEILIDKADRRSRARPPTVVGSVQSKPGNETTGCLGALLVGIACAFCLATIAC